MMYKKSKKVNPITKARSTRSDGKFLFPVKRPRSNMYAKSPLYRGVQLWDKLPPEVQKLESKQAFKAKIKILFDTKTKGKRKKHYAEVRRRNPVPA